MDKMRSKDGATIAFDQAGEGLPRSPCPGKPIERGEQL
jgi:hypothetical protein